MIEDLKVNRKEFLAACKAMQAAMKTQPGIHYVTLRFRPGTLAMDSAWGGAAVTTTGRETVACQIALNYIKLLNNKLGLAKSKDEFIPFTIATKYDKIIVGEGVLKVTFL
jgi:hypothetical protein